MTDKEDIFQHFGIPADDDKQKQEFLAAHEEEIKEFLLKKWERHSNKTVDETIETTEETSSENIQDLAPTTQMTDKQTEDLIKEKAKFDSLQSQFRNKRVSFPNGKVNQRYEALVNIEDILPETGEIGFEGLEEVGLQYNIELNRIEGVPQKAGDHKITMKCKRKDWVEGKPVFERDILLIINPDPRSLWNNIPTPDTVEYFKPDSDKQFIAVKSKKPSGLIGKLKKPVARKDMVAASQRGRSHAHEGKPRDDDFALHFEEESEWYILTVADGAGSAKFSRKGSEIACSTVIDVCKSKLEAHAGTFEKTILEFSKDESVQNRKNIGDTLYDIIGSAVFRSYKNIEREAGEQGNQLKDYATTLILAICKKFDFGWFVGSFWVGDGGIGIFTDEPEFLKVLGEPDGGEFAGQTRFLTMKEIIQPAEIYRRLRFNITDDFTALILMTDGITDPKFETDANLLRIRKWKELWQDLSGEVSFEDDNEQAADQLLSWLDFWSQGNHDDRTIAILF